MRAFDQAGNISHHEFGIVNANNAKVGMERGEGVIRDLGPRVRGGGQKGRLPRVGKPKKPHIRDQFQPQPDLAFNAGLAGIGTARRLIGRGLEVQISETAIAAGRQQHTLTNFGDIGQHRFLILVQNFGAHRHAQHDVGTVLAAALLAHARLTRFWRKSAADSGSR